MNKRMKIDPYLPKLSCSTFLDRRRTCVLDIWLQNDFVNRTAYVSSFLYCGLVTILTHIYHCMCCE